MTASIPEIGQFVETCGYRTNYHDQGEGTPVLMLHGSGAGATGWANWRAAIPVMAKHFRVIVPDLVGFGYTETPADMEFRHMDSWIEQVTALLDALKIERTHLIGNSFGGALSLQLADRFPDRIGRMVLMGSGGMPHTVGPELEALWGYKPSIENMKKILDIMAYDRSIVTDELAEMRYKTTLRPGSQENFERVFPPPRQRWLDAQNLPPERIKKLTNEVLIVHGRDDRVVPVHGSIELHQLIDRSQLHIFGRCGHWTMIEHRDRFLKLVDNFLLEGAA